MKNGFFLIEL